MVGNNPVNFTDPTGLAGWSFTTWLWTGDGYAPSTILDAALGTAGENLLDNSQTVETVADWTGTLDPTIASGLIKAGMLGIQARDAEAVSVLAETAKGELGGRLVGKAMGGMSRLRGRLKKPKSPISSPGHALTPPGKVSTCPASKAGQKSLLPGEGQVGTYDDLIAAGSKGDNITPHHIPSAKHMEQHGVPKGDGISINMEQLFPGTGGRHRQTFTYGSQADVDLSPRDALGRGVRDARRIYQDGGLYGPNIRGSLQDLIRQNKLANPGLFD